MSTEFRFICAMLATWRLTHLLTAEDGPFDVIVQLRARLGDSVAGRAMDCFYCLSIWMAAPLALFVATNLTEWLVTWLALSGGACLLERATTRDSTSLFPDRALREGAADELLWTEAPGIPDDERSPGDPEGRIAGSIGTDPTRLPR
jgi:hypothetical protein